MVNVRFLSPRVAFVDQNGMITKEWFLFLQGLFPAQSNSATDDMALASGDSNAALLSEVAELRKSVEDMREGTVIL